MSGARTSGDNSREVEVGHDEEKGGAADKDVVVVLLDGGKGARAGFGDYMRLSDG